MHVGERKTPRQKPAHAAPGSSPAAADPGHNAGDTRPQPRPRTQPGSRRLWARGVDTGPLRWISQNHAEQNEAPPAGHVTVAPLTAPRGGNVMGTSGDW